jgi:hypothetical protein
MDYLKGATKKPCILEHLQQWTVSHNWRRNNSTRMWNWLWHQAFVLNIALFHRDKMSKQLCLIWPVTVIGPHADRVICKVTLCFTLYPLFQWSLQSKEILLNLGMKCWNLAFNAQGLRVSIVVVQVGAVKIYVAAVQALRKKETQDETQFTIKLLGKTSLGPSYL